MKVGIIGSGGREHAICFALNKSKNIKKIYCFPGDAGTSQIAENISIDVEDFNGLKNFIITNKIDLVIVGPEKPLVKGIVDFLEGYNIKVFGPNKSASQLEGSKIFTKNLCEKYQIPNAKFGIFKNINDGNYVVCAISGKNIRLEELNYWNVDLQEPYFSYVEASIKREEEKN